MFEETPVHAIRRFLFCALAALLLPLLGTGLAAASQPANHPASRPAHPLAARTLHYDASRAPDYQDAITAAVANWNGDVQNVQIAAAAQGERADFTIAEDNDWPRTYPGQQVGTGQIVIGRTAVDQGFDRTRIVAHEMGHILGLPDNRDGQCTTLMSGHSAPVSCTDAHPNAAERASVEQNFAGGAAVRVLRTAALSCYTERPTAA